MIRLMERCMKESVSALYGGIFKVFFKGKIISDFTLHISLQPDVEELLKFQALNSVRSNIRRLTKSTVCTIRLQRLRDYKL